MEILVGDTLYFSANDGSSGYELWAHDTSNASTWRVADINSGSGHSYPGHYMDAILVGDTLYFSANDGSSGHELWAHDTSNASTWQVADIYSGTGTSNPGYYGMEILVGDTLYFSADDGSSGWELWAHDTSNASTWQVADIDSGTGNSKPGQHMEILVGDTLYFDASDGSSGCELWALQPSEITSLSSGSGSGGSGSGSGGMTNLTNATSCVASPSLPNGLNIDSSTCTISGTPTVTTSNATYTVTAVINSTTFQTTVWLSSSPFATITSTVEGAHLNLGEAMGPITLNYTSQAGNGTLYNGNGTTWQVADYGGESGSSVPGVYMEILVGDTLYFSANDGSSGRELWAHDASNSSTWQVADIESGTGNSNPGQYMEILVGDTLYFGATDGSSGHELWAHDTSNASTWQVADINSGTGSSNPGYCCYPGQDMSILVGDTLYFSATDGSSGYELWAHDTSNASTWRVTDIRSGGDSNPGQYMSILVGDTLYFSAEDGSYDSELWAHDTSNASTWRVADINSGSIGSSPGSYMSMLVGDTLYFSAYDASTSSGTELWAHDTSNASTWRVADINSGIGSSTPGQSMSIFVGDTLYFSATDGSSGNELWAHDTSNASTWQVADINSGLATVTPEMTCRYSSVIRSTSMRLRQAAATNCGLMIPQTLQLGG